MILSFEKNSTDISSDINDSNETRLKSDEVLRIISKDLINIGYKVEISKKGKDIKRVPVLYGVNGGQMLSFEADAYNYNTRTVIEVEAGRALTNYQFLKDIFQASMMIETDYLVIAVRQLYRGNNDFENISKFIETMFITNRIKLSLEGILLIGY